MDHQQPPPEVKRGRPRGQAKVGGRKKGAKNRLTADVKALAREYGPAAIQTLFDLMVDDETPHATRRAAAVDLLDRGFGRPATMLEIDPSNPNSLPAFIGLVGVTDADVKAERERRALKAEPEFLPDEDDDGDDDDTQP